MEKKDDYISGTHHYGTHLVCGAIFGAMAGAWIGAQLSGSGWVLSAAAAVGATSLGYSAVVGGDLEWRWIL